MSTKINTTKRLNNEIDESLTNLFSLCNRLEEGIGDSTLNMLEKKGVSKSIDSIWTEYKKIHTNRQKIRDIERRVTCISPEK